MAKYILSKKAKGKKYQYTVTDEKGNVISTRTSAREYVACTADGSFYFGRLDLIGKGDPDRMIEFYVTGQQYDVYHLAFKGFIKG